MRRAVLVALLTLAAGSASSSAADEGEACAAASATVRLDSVRMDGREVVASGGWDATGGATSVVLEYRVDSDRYRTEIRAGERREWNRRFEFELCGEHHFRVFAFPLVTAADRQIVCLDRAHSQKLTFSVHCGVVPSFTGCEWRCESGACTGSCTVAVENANAPVLLMLQEGEGGYRAAAPVGSGPFRIDLTCRAGDAVRVRARAQGANRFSPPVERTCGLP